MNFRIKAFFHRITPSLKILLHLVAFFLLTVITQVGGLVYLISILLIRKKAKGKTAKRFGMFIGLYCLATFLIVPYMAPIFGREKIKESESVRAHNFFYKFTNRNYVRPELNLTLASISTKLEEKHPGIKLIYLDANFPFIDKFPLLPHLSHNDGKKIDVTFIYEVPEDVMTNNKPSISGYGVFERPKNKEFNQTTACKSKGYWQYDFPKYLTFGSINQEIQLSESGTRDLTNIIVEENKIGKLFIEPHLKNRLNLKSQKIRFHGCQAVRHDDHIHFQLK